MTAGTHGVQWAGASSRQSRSIPRPVFLYNFNCVFFKIQLPCKSREDHIPFSLKYYPGSVSGSTPYGIRATGTCHLSRSAFVVFTVMENLCIRAGICFIMSSNVVTPEYVCVHVCVCISYMSSLFYNESTALIFSELTYTHIQSP